MKKTILFILFSCSIFAQDLQAFAILPSGTTIILPITTSAVNPSNTSVTVNLLESKTTNTLLISSAEGLENNAAAGTIVYLNVKGN